MRSARWTVARSDVPAGGLAVVRLVHPLLPEFTRMRATAEGLSLEPVTRPGPLVAEEPGPFLVRLLGLASFLHAAGLGIAPRDAGLVGTRADGAPALGAAPVPVWRSLPPALLVAATAARLAGKRVPEESVDAVRLGLERLALRGALGEIVGATLRSEGAPTGSLLRTLWASHAASAPLGGDLLGLVLPDLGRVSEEGRIGAAWGAEALLLARAAARRDEAGFCESGPGAILENGASLARLVDVLGSDPRAEALRSRARGEAARVPEGEPLVLVARGWERWDRRSREAWEELPEGCGLTRVEVRAAAPPPWERRHPLELRVGVAEAAALVHLPLASLAESVGLWERLARSCGGDFARLVALARQTARGLGPGPGLPRTAARAARGASPVLSAAACLLEGFEAGEAALAADVPEGAASEALVAAAAEGTLEEIAPACWRFVDEEGRRALASGLGAGARRALALRLESLPDERRIAAGLARGEERDVAAARELLTRAFADGRQALVVALLARAPARCPDLLEPLLAFLARARVGRRDEALAAAARLGDASGEPFALRAEAARVLARLGKVEAALGLVADSGDPEETLARARVLLDVQRPAEAARLVSGLGTRLAGMARVERWLLLCEIAERDGRYGEATAALRRAVRLLERLGPGAVHPEAARSAGFLVSDLRRHDEALAFFRRARDEARSAEGRADAVADLAVTAHHAGRHREAMRQTDAALAAFAALGDRERWVSILGNRADLFVSCGDADGARRDLEAVLEHDRRPGREHQLLFALPTLQRLLLAEGDLSGAAAAFAEATALRQPQAHGAWREALLQDARRLLMARRPGDAEARLAEAGTVPDNRVENEPLRIRLRASSAIDRGETSETDGLPPEERRLLEVERTLRSGGAASRAAVEAVAKLPGGSFRAAERVVEWASRFPEALARQPEFARLGAEAAARAGLRGAEALLSPASTAPRAPAPLATPPVSDELLVAEPAMRALLGVVERIAPTAIPVLVLGESGTGKELVARRVHALSRRRGPFVPVNVAALAPTLVESELFGHARGAFTGAERERTGLVEASSGGTLFLDEIGDLPLGLQAKLLRVLQERELVRVGETRPRKVDLRVVAATHRPLAEMATEGTFRFDLYQRLAGITLRIPPLRDRPRDLAAILERGLDGRRASPEARRLLLAHPWPGNVRELLSALESARALAGEEPIGPEHLPASVRRDAEPAALSYEEALRAAKRRIFKEALDASGGNRTHAAKRLKISRQSLLYEIRKLGL